MQKKKTKLISTVWSVRNKSDAKKQHPVNGNEEKNENSP